MYTVYTYWDADGIIAVLNAIVLIMGAGDYMGLMQTLAISGLLIAAGVGMAKISREGTDAILRVSRAFLLRTVCSEGVGGRDRRTHWNCRYCGERAFWGCVCVLIHRATSGSI